VARVVAIANQKGGVGKSTTAVSLGAALADLGHRVLVVDLDPQGNASTGLGIRHEAREITVYNVVVSESPIRDAIVATPVERLHAVPSTIDLAGAEIELVSQFSRESRLKKALEPIIEGSYDFIFLDCPPSLGLLTINALTAAEELIVPIQCEYYALEGLGQLLRNVSLVQQNINHGLRLSGIVMTMFDPRTKLSEQVVEEVRKFFGDLVYDVIIPRTVRLSEAPGFGQPITVYDPRSKGAESYRLLAVEVARRPPPAEPMPVFEDLPTVALSRVDPVTREATDEADLEELPEPPIRVAPEHADEGAGGSTPGVTVVRGEDQEPAAEVEALAEVDARNRPTRRRTSEAALRAEATPREASPPAEAREAAPSAGADSGEAAPPRKARVPTPATAAEGAEAGEATPPRKARESAPPAERKVTERPHPATRKANRPAKPAGPAETRPREAARALEVEAREPSTPEEADGPTIAGFEIDLPLGEDEFWEESDELSTGEEATPASRVPGQDSERRVVVIDEDAELDAATRDSDPRGEPSPQEDVAMAKIGATLEEQKTPRRRWRLFRKGGD
jgi:chromosome partitioning protein